MVEFGKQLRESIQQSTWRGEYLDYERLKAILKGKKDKNGNLKKSSFSSGHLDLYNRQNYHHQHQHQHQHPYQGITATSSNPMAASTTTTTTTHSIHMEFHRALNKEIEKVVLFLLQEQGRIAQELSRLALQRDACAEQVAITLKDFAAKQEFIALTRSATTTTSTATTISKRNVNNNNNNNGAPPTQMDLESSSSILLTSSSLESLNTNIATCMDILALNYKDYRTIAESVVNFVSYVEMNVTAVRKILKKHDKRYPQHKLGQSYLSSYTRRIDSHLDQLYHYGGLSALIVTLKRAFSELHILEVLLLWMQNGGEGGIGEGGSSTDDTNNNTMKRSSTTTRTTTATAINGNGSSNNVNFDNMNGTTYRRVQSLSSMDYYIDGKGDGYGSTYYDNNTLLPSQILTRRPSGVLSYIFGQEEEQEQQQQQQQQHLNVDQNNRGMTEIVSTARLLPTNIETKITSRHEPILEHIHLARSRLEQSSNYVQVIAAQSAMFFIEDDEDLVAAAAAATEDYLKQETEMTRTQQISSLLNLCSTFLYMTNYYIVAPTCGTYAAKLGSSEAMAGIIIGMTPNAALIATVLYCWWSNYSYKSALIFAAGSSMLGNVCYALALRQNSLWLVMAGRFFNGFGSARSINRRFIADAFSRNQRTAASAAFVAAGTLGMAAGPAIAAIIARFPIKEGEDDLLWTTETAPGWVMLFLWSIFFVTAIIFFEEPDRSLLYGTSATTSATTSNDNVTTTLEKEDPSKFAATAHSETKPLLDKPSNSVVSTDSTKKSISNDDYYRKTPVLMTLWNYFILKLVLESMSSSCGNLTKFYFGWDSQTIGTFLAFLGLLMFPANVVVARLSHHYEDRELIFGTLMIMFFSILGIFVYDPNNYTVYQYVFFSVCTFTSTNILEGPNMSLLSKTIPKSWAKGIFNSGFLATEAGTLARSIGDVIISAADAVVGPSNLLNASFFPPLIFIFISLIMVRYFFDQLIEDDEDDNDNISGKSDDKQPSSSSDK